MQNIAKTFGDDAPPDLSRLADKIADATSQLKDKVSELGQTAADTIDRNREAAAGGLEKTAHALHDKAGELPGGEKVASLAHTTADTFDTTADYVRKHNVNSMRADLMKLVKNNPGPALLTAATLGFLMGRAFSSND
jgi:ElaB/YqjD/DUF883 family membrane-anchored ribosome-binding protein